MKLREMISTGPPRAPPATLPVKLEQKSTSRSITCSGTFKRWSTGYGMWPMREVALLRDRIENAVAAIKAALTVRAQQALDRGEHYVRAQPWLVVGIAATSGLLIGLFIGGPSRRLARAAEGVRGASNARPC